MLLWRIMSGCHDMAVICVFACLWAQSRRQHPCHHLCHHQKHHSVAIASSLSQNLEAAFHGQDEVSRQWDSLLSVASSIPANIPWRYVDDS